MAFKVQDVVKVNLVIVGLRLLGTPEEFERFQQVTGTDVQMVGAGLLANISAGITEPGHTLALSRDRITLELSRSRSTISRDYPLREDLYRLAEVAHLAIENTSVSPSPTWTFGLNIELVFDQSSATPAFAYLSSRLFDVHALGKDNWQLIGGAGSLIFRDGVRRWTIKLEPRFNSEAESRIFLSANLHVDNQPLPDEITISHLLEELWDQSHEFVQSLDEKEIHRG